jgi:hypothetical protein
MSLMSWRTFMRDVPLLCAAFALTACHRQSGSAPLLSAVAPDIVNIGGGRVSMLTVRGHGFERTNTVHFGALRIPDVPRTNDSVMQFAVPTDDTFLPDRGPAPLKALGAGRYDLRIANRRGTSNAVVVTLTSGGEAR